MHKVKRIPCSNSVCLQLTTWQQQLNDELNNSTNTSQSALANQHWNNKNTRLLKDELLKTYKGCCCYCEGKITDTGYGHIEHRIPKSKEPGRTFDEANLHISCERCNINKGDKFNKDAEVLDACNDDINKHIVFEDTFLVSARTSRGTTTIDDCNLNRHELMEARQSVYDDSMNLLGNINQSSSDTELHSRNRNRLLKKAEHGEAYCSMVRLILNKNRNSFIDIDESKWEE